jgi:hypothetical protein
VATNLTPQLWRSPATTIRQTTNLQVFSIVPLSANEWALVLLFALPVILIDEVLKFFGRRCFGVQHVTPTKRPSQAAAAASQKLKAT